METVKPSQPSVGPRPWTRMRAALRRFLLGSAGLTPEQEARIREMERDCRIMTGLRQDETPSTISQKNCNKTNPWQSYKLASSKINTL